MGKTYLYSYDSNGNILTRGEAAYTTSSSVTAETTVNYEYVDGKLTSYNGQSCAYDMVGNPTTYRGKTAVWARGRKLSSYNGNTFTYDGEGRRRTKNGITYYYDGQGRLTRQSNGLSYYYDSTGLVALKYNGTYYVYRKDAQGNIIAVLDILGNKVVEYKYDAWGNHTVTGSNTALGNLNPFRYRGYYYDTETGLYYLQTRYYDPEVGRFLNMDSIDYADPESLDGLNLYAYCNNNPVMGYDPTGHFAFSVLVGMILGAIVGGAVGGVVAYNQASKSGATGWELAGWTALGVIGGGLVGGAAGAGIGAVASTFGGFLSSSFSFALANGGSVAISRAQIAISSLVVGWLLAQIPMQGIPNSTIQQGGSYGEYDENGNLMYRTDTDHYHYIKKYQASFKPHTHHFEWKIIKGIWRYIETILPW